MATKDKLLELLENKRDEYVSGEEISKNLGLSRTAVWKAINSLRADGYNIDAISNKGYRLAKDSDILSVQGISKYLTFPEKLDLTVYPVVDSTNNVLKKLAQDGAKEGTCVIAAEQSAGRGRIGRSFYSPSGSGIYLSLLLKPGNIPAERSVLITTMAAVAVCMAIEKTTKEKPGIKWVNDIFLDGKKVCGILTEGAVSMENGYLDYAVLGVGLNAYLPEGNAFPEELKKIAGPIYKAPQSDGKNLLAAEFLNAFLYLYYNEDPCAYQKEYRKRCFVIGKDISVLSPLGTFNAKAIDIDDDCHLIVEYEDGRRETLSSGEISIRVSE